MRQKLQNSKGYAESPEILPVLRLFIFKKKSVATTWSSLDYNFYTHTYIYINTMAECRFGRKCIAAK